MIVRRRCYLPIPILSLGWTIGLFCVGLIGCSTPDPSRDLADDTQGQLASPVQVAVRRALATEARALGLDQDPVVAAKLAGAEQRLLIRALRHEIARTVEISAADLDRELEARRQELVQPRRVQLRNLFKRVSPDAEAAERVAIRAQVQELRRELLAGADFGEAARRESDSQTGRRGGRMGMVKLGDLPPALEKIAFALVPGEISPILEHPEGFTLLYCDQVVEEHVLDESEARQRLESWLRRQEAERLWTELVSEVGDGEEERLAAHARARHLDTPDLRRDLEQRQLELLAEAALDRRVGQHPAAPPTEQDLREHFDAHRGRYLQPEELDLAVLRLPIKAGESPVGADLAIDLLRKLQRGEITFDAAAREHSRHPSASRGGELGWLPRPRVAALGADVLRAVTKLEPGERTEPVRTGGAWWILELRGRRAPRQMGFDEASEIIRRELQRRREQELRREVEERLITELGLTVAR